MLFSPKQILRAETEVEIISKTGKGCREEKS